MIETVVLVSGWRGRTNVAPVEFRLINYHKATPRPLLIHGACKTGVDKIARMYAERKRWAIASFPVDDFDRKGAAGDRHANMIDLARLYLELGSKVFVEAFPDEQSVGTWDLVNKAKAAELNLFINGKAHEYKQKNLFKEVDPFE